LHLAPIDWSHWLSSAMRQCIRAVLRATEATQLV
jgi:hypothetical protein